MPSRVELNKYTREILALTHRLRMHQMRSDVLLPESLHPYLVYVSSEGSSESVHFECDKCQNDNAGSIV